MKNLIIAVGNNKNMLPNSQSKSKASPNALSCALLTSHMLFSITLERKQKDSKHIKRKKWIRNKKPLLNELKLSIDYQTIQLKKQQKRHLQK